MLADLFPSSSFGVEGRGDETIVMAKDVKLTRSGKGGGVESADESRRVDGDAEGCVNWVNFTASGSAMPCWFCPFKTVQEWMLIQMSKVN